MGIVHKKWVPTGQTVNQYYYKDIFERLRKRVMRVCPNIATNWILHHDNATAHAVFFVAQFLTSKGITVMPQPPYSPDLAPCDFFLFQKTKSAVKGHHFESTKDIQWSVTQALNDVPQAALQECYKQWQHCWKTCAGTRDVLWRWQYFSWWVNKIKHFFGTSLITLLSDLVVWQKPIYWYR